MVAEPWSPQSAGSAAPGPAGAGGPASAGAAPGPEAPGGEFELVGPDGQGGWYRLARSLRKLFRLRRTWASLGQHLRDFTELRPRSERR